MEKRVQRGRFRGFEEVWWEIVLGGFLRGKGCEWFRGIIFFCLWRCFNTSVCVRVFLFVCVCVFFCFFVCVFSVFEVMFKYAVS